MSGQDDGLPAGQDGDNPASRQHGKRIIDVIEGTIRWVQITLFSAMIILVFYEVVMRYVFNAPTVWSEAAARLCMVWMVILGMNIAIRHSDHIRVDFFVDGLSARWQTMLGWFRIAVVVLVCLVLIQAGYKVAVDNLTQIASGTRISVFWKYIVVPFGAVLALIFLLERIIDRNTKTF